MKKYFLVTKNTWDEIFMYRLNFSIWRIRTVLQLLTIYFLWSAVIPQNGQVFGYTQPMMLTYILGTALIGSFVLSTRTHEVGENVNTGNLSIFLIRPINYFLYWFFRDLGDKAINISFSFVEIALLILIFHPPLFIQTDPFILILALFSMVIAILLYFFLGFLFGLIGFWSPDVWAPRFILYIVIVFFSGGLFPIDILPKPLFALSQLLPFSYLLYFPVKVYLGQLDLVVIVQGIVISIIWIFIFYGLIHLIWNKGIKTYSAEGR